MNIYIYQDKKYKPIMLCARRPYPYGDYLGHYDTLTEAETAISQLQQQQTPTGIPLCDALIRLKMERGEYDIDGLTLLTEITQ